MDVVRPLGLAGIRSIAVAPRGAPARASRFTDRAMDPEPASLVERLQGVAEGEPEPPVLYYESDWSLALVSRSRDRLADAYRFLMPEAETVDALLDKRRFKSLATRLDLPVPRTVVVDEGAAWEEDPDLRFPVVLKPLPYRDPEWDAFLQAGSDGRATEPAALRPLAAKAVRAGTPDALRLLLDRLRAAGLGALVQELIPGPESRVESYHAYVDSRGSVAGEFTGRKIRTYPSEFGRSTAVTTTDDPGLRGLGRELVERLELKGVVKLDFKRDPAGQPLLLEVNPRFSLWCHLGALAGVNLPAIAYADLTGAEPPPRAAARSGVTWCRPRADLSAARQAGLPLASWLRFALAADIRSGVSLDDPRPLLARKLAR